MSDQALRAALLKLHSTSPLPASQFTPAQRNVLDRFARQTGAVTCQRQGRGDVYSIVNPVVFDAHLLELAPQRGVVFDESLPLRAQHVAQARSSKAGQHHHSTYYPTLKAVGASVSWRDGKRGITLDLAACTRDFGAATVAIQADDAWQTDQALWLIENQALFDRTDWLPAGMQASLLYYGGQLDGRLLSWLGNRPRASRVWVFPDYDGVGLANVARLHEVLGEACECWLMPDWETKLARYGSSPLWRKTLPQFAGAVDRLPAYLRGLTDQMQRAGLALEQEAVWSPA